MILERKEVLFRADVHSLDRRSRNAYNPFGIDFNFDVDCTGTGDKNCRIHQGFGVADFSPCKDSPSKPELIR